MMILKIVKNFGIDAYECLQNDEELLLATKMDKTGWKYLLARDLCQIQGNKKFYLYGKLIKKKQNVNYG